MTLHYLHFFAVFYYICIRETKQCIIFVEFCTISIFKPKVSTKNVRNDENSSLFYIISVHLLGISWAFPHLLPKICPKPQKHVAKPTLWATFGHINSVYPKNAQIKIATKRRAPRPAPLYFMHFIRLLYVNVANNIICSIACCICCKINLPDCLVHNTDFYFIISDLYLFR